MSELFDDLLASATGTQEVKDPKVGEFEATLSAVDTKQTRDGEGLYLVLTWSGMVGPDGYTFEQDDRLFAPRHDSLYFQVKQFWSKLVALGVVPASVLKQGQLPLLSNEGVEKLAIALTEKIGSVHRIKITERNDFYNVSIVQPK